MGEREGSVARVSPRGDGALLPAGDAAPSAPNPLSSVVQPTLPLVALPGAAPEGAEGRHLLAVQKADNHRRVHALVNEYMDFVWRSLRRLGVADPDCDDGCQRVWVVVAQKLGAIEGDKIRSFVFSVVVRVASEMRRNYRRHQHLALDELDVEPTRPDTEGLVEQRRVRELLDQLLSGLSWDLRTVFVMYEIEGMSSPEIAEVLGISRGTAASRLRLAREAFQRNLQRHRARARSSSDLGAPSTSGSHSMAGSARLVVKNPGGVA